MPVCVLFLVCVFLFNLSNPIVISITISAVCLVLFVLLDPVMSLCVLCNTWRPQPKCKCAYARYSIEHRCYWSSLLDKKRKLLNILQCLYLFYLSIEPTSSFLYIMSIAAVLRQSCYFHLLLLHCWMCNIQLFWMLILLLVCHLHVLCALICFHFFFTDAAYQLIWLIVFLKSPFKNLFFPFKSTNNLPVYFRHQRHLLHACNSVFLPWLWNCLEECIWLVSFWWRCLTDLCTTLMVTILMGFRGHFCCIAETERQGTDHLDLAGLPQRSQNSDSTHTLPTTPDSKKKSKGIKKIFGK